MTEALKNTFDAKLLIQLTAAGIAVGVFQGKLATIGRDVDKLGTIPEQIHAMQLGSKDFDYRLKAAEASNAQFRGFSDQLTEMIRLVNTAVTTAAQAQALATENRAKAQSAFDRREWEKFLRMNPELKSPEI